MNHNSIIKIEHLRKVYGSTIAVDDISFEVYENEIFGMVGPNGAGKTTTIECIEGLRRPDSGEMQVLGLNPHRNEYALTPRIGVQLQESALPHRIKVWEALDLFASFYPQSISWNNLIEQLGLNQSRNTPFARLSGGQKQRLFIALALINDPELVFLDELTTGLDPQARRAMWDMVRDVRNKGKTVFLTTHFMEEAERLCDRVAIMDQGKIVALDSPENLIRNLGAEHRVVFNILPDSQANFDRMNHFAAVTRVETIGERIVVHGQGDRLVVEVVSFLTEHGIPFRDLRTERPTLEDVFLVLTGREMHD
jgi:ABC-2 type transport system ATP-binding protein